MHFDVHLYLNARACWNLSATSEVVVYQFVCAVWPYEACFKSTYTIGQNVFPDLHCICPTKGDILF